MPLLIGIDAEWYAYEGEHHQLSTTIDAGAIQDNHLIYDMGKIARQLKIHRWCTGQFLLLLQT